MRHLNLKVLVFESDFYALQAINSYLAWDRRTRVVGLAQSLDRALDFLKRLPKAECPDVILLESKAFTDTNQLAETIKAMRALVEDVMIICLAHKSDPRPATVAMESGARGYLLRDDVKLQLVWAICYALDYSFLITGSIRDAVSSPFDSRLLHATVLPQKRDYPEMSDRIEQALWLCVVEGMPAQLAADEMGVSPHTIRSYIKEGYRILEAHDATEYPKEMGPLERAFMRFTALEEDEDEKNEKPPAQ